MGGLQSPFPATVVKPGDAVALPLAVAVVAEGQPGPQALQAALQLQPAGQIHAPLTQIQANGFIGGVLFLVLLLVEVSMAAGWNALAIVQPAHRQAVVAPGWGIAAPQGQLEGAPVDVGQHAASGRWPLSVVYFIATARAGNYDWMPSTV